jgi:tRNA pseudouridine38-40 synthase
VPASEQIPQASYRIALGVEYEGTHYSGWQRQLSPLQETVQQHVERALSQIANRQVSVICAGRTDAGVHATCQVIHFDCAIDRGTKAWVVGSNSLLPDSIRILWAKNVSADFHARFSATSRRYFYLIYQRKIASVMFAGRISHERAPLDLDAMNAAAQFLPGERDFSAFRAAGCQSKSANRNIMHARLYQEGSLIVFDIQANAFLQHMVRNIIGSLLVVGRGQQSPGWIDELLQGKDRSRAGKTASPHGLYLVGVNYPPQFEIPGEFSAPGFLAASA